MPLKFIRIIRTKGSRVKGSCCILPSRADSSTRSLWKNPTQIRQSEIAGITRAPCCA